MSNDPQILRRDLAKETAAVATLLGAFKEAIGQDEEAAQLTIESESNFVEVAERVLYRLGEIKTLTLAIDQQIELIRSRKGRLELQQTRLRAALAHAIEQIGVKRIETASATLTIKALPRKSQIFDESVVPDEFWVTPPRKPNLTLINTTIRAGVEIPGVALDNGGQTLQITYS